MIKTQTGNSKLVRDSMIKKFKKEGTDLTLKVRDVNN